MTCSRSCTVMIYVVMGNTVMACIVVGYIVTAFIVAAYRVTPNIAAAAAAHIDTAKSSYCLYTQGYRGACWCTGPLTGVAALKCVTTPLPKSALLLRCLSNLEFPFVLSLYSVPNSLERPQSASTMPPPLLLTT